MANSEAGTSDDAAPASGNEYQVFLSFRGPDTRHGFTDFLYNGLLDVGVRVFRDDDELRVGEVIGENLLSAINNSVIYIPIFSRTYASSKWCLRELAHIVDVSKSEDEKCIFPIFLDVEPDDVKLKTPIYSNALSEHEKTFPNEVEEWRAALAAVGKIKGWNVTSSQALIVTSIVTEVLKKLKIKQKLVTVHLVGLDDRVKELTKLLDVNCDDVRLIGIYGMGGIGKTTIAMVIYNQLCCHFGKCCSFIEGIRERSTKEGIVSLQKQLLSDIGVSKTARNIKNSEEGMRRIGATLSNKKVIVVLDDVDKRESIENLLGNSKLYQGSRIIITTRDTSVLKVKGFKGETRRYEMLKMDVGPALQLFGQHAFSENFPFDDYHHQLSSDIVSSTGGLPLAIEVIGSMLNGKDQEIWEETLEKLRNVPEKQILEKLRISYDDLEEHQKQIFLDIACFLFNENKIDAIYMWTVCKFFPIQGIEVLTSRCLVKILDDDKLWMHDQLIALGRQIVREESRYYLGKRSRLWNAQDALQIIGTEETKHEIQALEISSDGRPIEIRNEDFGRLPSLRILILKCGTFVGDFAACLANLRWFSWSYPSFWRHSLDWTFRADNLCLNQLIVCKLYKIDFNDDSKAWDLIKRAENLKVLSITWCSGITTIPNISRCLALERLTLARCSGLKRIESFIGDLRSLIELKIIDCSNLTDLPKEVGALVKLKCFSLRHCKRLRELPDSLGNLTSLTELDLSGMMILELPNFILQLKSLEILRFPLWPFNVEEDHDWQLTCGIDTMVHHLELDLSRRRRGGMKCEILVRSEKLSYLGIPNLEYTCFGGIPRTINTIHDLHILDLTDCHEIQELPELPTSWTYVDLRPTSFLRVPSLEKLTNLVNLLLRDGSDYEGKSKLIPGCDLRGIVNLSRLKWVELRLLNVPANPQLTYPSQPQEIVLGHLDSKPPVQFPSSNWRWRNLSTLEIYCCEVEDILLDGLSRLESLRVFECEWLQRLSIPLEFQLRKLQQVTVESCRGLIEIQFVDVSKSLEGLTVLNCKSLTIISGVSYLKNLERLTIEYCYVLTKVEGLNELESVKALSVCHCLSLRWLIDASCTKLPNDCIVHIWGCGYFIKDSIEDPRSMEGTPLKHYRKILQNTSKKTETEDGKKATAWREKFKFGGTSKESGNNEIEKEKGKQKPMIIELAVAAMEELVRMAQMGEPLWSESLDGISSSVLNEDEYMKTFPQGIRPKPAGFNTEASRESAVVIMDHINLVEILMDVNQWSTVFSSIVSRAATLEVLSTGVAGNYNGALQVMTAEFQVPTPLVPTREVYFVRYCKKHSDGAWAVVDVSLDNVCPSPIVRCRRRPSGCVIQEMPNGYSKVTWVENVEVDDRGVHSLYKQLVNSGHPFGAKRWVTAFNRQCERLASAMATNIPNTDIGVIMSQEGRKSMLKLAERMVISFWAGVSASTAHTWTTLSGTGAGEMRVITMNSIDDPGRPPGLVMSAATSFWLPVLPNRVFDFLCDMNSRSEWDILLNGGAVQMVHITNGRDTGNCVSLLQENFSESAKSSQSSVLILQESCTDSAGSYVIFAPVDRFAMNEVLNGRDSDYVALLPSGFAILPDGSAMQGGNDQQAVGSGGGSLLTVAFQILVNSVPTVKLSPKAVAPINNLIACTFKRIEASLLSPGRGMTLSLGMGRGSSSRTDTTKMGTTSNPKRGITSSSQSGASLSIGRGRGSTLGEGATVSSGRGMTLSLGTGRDSSSRTDTTKMGTASIPGRGITSSSPSGTYLSTGRGRGSTSENEITASSRRGKTLSSRRGATKMGTSLRSWTNIGLSIWSKLSFKHRGHWKNNKAKHEQAQKQAEDL